MDGCTDGTHMGEKYFDCPPGKAIFCRLNELLPDERLNNVPITSGNASIENRKVMIIIVCFLAC